MDRLRTAVTNFLNNFLQNPLTAYGSILLLQLKVIWGMWWYRDLTLGDTTSYFLNAVDWHLRRETWLSWSPLYTAYYGTFIDLFRDAYAATIGHRVVIIFAATAVVLAIARWIMPPAFAWFVAAWWAVLPINYDALYEVHMFAVVPILFAVCLAFTLPGKWGRGACLGALVASVILVRTELILAVLLYIFIAAALEWREKVQSGGSWFRALLLPYLVPATAALLLISVFAVRAHDRHVFGAMMEDKHVVNLCESFAYGYQQRHPEWTKSPWTECYGLMQTLFGDSKPTFTQAFLANPGPLIEQVLWNASMIPNGLQVALFNATSGTRNPDFAPVHLNSAYPNWLTVFFLLVLAIGLAELWKRRRDWSGPWAQERVNGFAALFPIVLVGVFAMLTQRPRPSYFFGLTVALMALVGTCAWAIARKLGIESNVHKFAPLASLLMLVFMPSHFSAGDRPLNTHYGRLAPFSDLFRQSDTVFASNLYGSELCSYLGSRTCTPLNFSSISHAPEFTDLESKLQSQGATLVYAEETVTRLPSVAALLIRMEGKGWHRIAGAETPKMSWRLLQRDSSSGSPKPAVAPVPDDIYQVLNMSLGGGWYGPELFNGERFRWVNNDAVISVAPHDSRLVIRFQIESGPGTGTDGVKLHILQGRRELLASRFIGRRWLEVPSPPSKTTETIRLHTEGGGLPARGDARILNFRVIRIETRPGP